MLNEMTGKRLRLSPKSTVKERLLAYSSAPTDSGCIEWLGAKGSLGYGRMTVKGVLVAPHRQAYIEVYGEIPNNLWVLHSCDNPKCINPQHLRVGTPVDNAGDRVVRGRSNVPKGANSPHAKLTESEVRAILADTRTDTLIAEDYSVNRATIWAIKSGKSWKNVPR